MITGRLVSYLTNSLTMQRKYRMLSFSRSWQANLVPISTIPFMLRITCFYEIIKVILNSYDSSSSLVDL